MLEKNELYEKLSNERKQLQSEGKIPVWMTTAGWQLIKNKNYIYKANSLKTVFERNAETLAKHLKPEHREYYKNKFFEVQWKGWFSNSTPMYNLGTDRGFPISCTGNDIDDSVFGFYDSTLEVSMLTKEHFGTSSYLGDIRPRGSKISKGGTSSGILPVMKMHAQVMADITQGTTRRGSWGGYIDVMHGDFDEVLDEVMANPEPYNIGINYYDVDLIKLSNGESEIVRRFQKHMKLRAVFGKGYFYFPDRVARLQPGMYKKHGLRSKASNLCSEVTLHADSEHSFTCVLGNLNLAKYDEWKDTDTIEVCLIMLDCVISEMLDMIDKKPKHEQYAYRKIKSGTEKSRALGLGVLGFHTYLQQKMIPFESMDAIIENEKLFKEIQEKTLKASQWLAKEYGEPEWCKGFGVRNTHRTMIAPTTAGAVIQGGVSRGIEPIYANTYSEKLAGGLVSRINPQLLQIMKDRNVLSQELIDEIGTIYKGSVQHVKWLTDIEKQVFKTAFEIDQKVLIDLAADRQKFVCQAQSLNLFFEGDADEKEMSRIHLYAMFNPYIKSLYYMRGQRNAKASDGKSVVEEPKSVCESCEA